MAILDVFNQDMFKMASLTAVVEQMPKLPTLLGDLKLFEEKGVAQNTVVVEERDNVLALVTTQTRGGPATVARSGKRTGRSFLIPHIPYEDVVLASDIQDVRAFGSEDQTQGVVQVVNDRIEAMRRDILATIEYHRVGAVHGKILDADGSSTIYNLFTEFGVTETTVDFAFTTATTDIRALCVRVRRYIQDALGNAPFTKIHAICGPTWYDSLVSHPVVQSAYDRWNDGAALRDDTPDFTFGGIEFHEYVASLGSVDYVSASQARFFPVGCPGLFQMVYGPGNFMESANTIGLPMYAKQERMDFDRGIRIVVESNPLALCTRPLCLVKGTLS